MNRRKFLISTAVGVSSAIPALSENTNTNKLNKRRARNFVGKIIVNGKILTKNTKIKANDTITTGKNSFAMFSIGEDAFRVGANAKVMFKGSSNVNSVVIRSGKFLGVFKKGNNRKIKTQNATMGIRGTGVFVHAISSTKTKFCTCYGKTTIRNSDKTNSRVLEATHHKALIVENNAINKPPIWSGFYEYFINPSHTDNQLRAIESLVQRVPYFDRGGRSPLIEL